MWRKSRSSRENHLSGTNGHHFKSCRDIKSNVPFGPFPTFSTQNSFFGSVTTTEIFNSFPGRCNTLSFLYLKCQFQYHFSDSLTRNGKNGTAGTDTEHLGGLVEDYATCAAPHLLVTTRLASQKRTNTNSELSRLAARPELAKSL